MSNTDIVRLYYPCDGLRSVLDVRYCHFSDTCRVSVRFVGQYLTSRALLRPSHGYYNLTISMLLTNPLRQPPSLTLVSSSNSRFDYTSSKFTEHHCFASATKLKLLQKRSMNRSQGGRNFNYREQCNSREDSETTFCLEENDGCVYPHGNTDNGDTIFKVLQTYV